MLINKYGIRPDEVEPTEVLIALHKRVVETENLVKKLVIQLNNYGQELEMVNEKLASMNSIKTNVDEHV